MAALSFEIQHRDTSSHARLGRVTTPHGAFDTPAFMPVGTQGAVKGLLPAQVADTGAQIILANTYHLMLRPGCELVAQMGGLQRWMQWGGPILTDSGGFQVFSLADINRVDDDGVTFRSHIDGAAIELTPERSMQVQNQLGADIIMAFDDCPPMVETSGGGSRQSAVGSREEDADDEPNHPLTAGRHAIPLAEYPKRIAEASERTVRWLERCVRAHGRADDQALFGIVQGGLDLAARDWCAERVTQFDLPGYAIGGVAVGEGHERIRQVVEHTAPLLPEDRPRYLMGVGYERDIVAAVRAGVDMFDCVLPTRNGRNACAFTRTGAIRLRNARFRDDRGPIEPGCDCPACGGIGDQGSGIGEAPEPHFSRSYLRHLFMAGEMLGPILVSLHNLRHFQRLLLDIREAIRQNAWSLVAERWPVTRDAG